MSEKINLIIPAKSKKIDSINDPICEEFLKEINKH
jgi:hypothetical protein